MSQRYRYIEEISESVLRKSSFFKPGFDVEKLAKKLGVLIHPANLDHGVSGLFVRIEGKPVISVAKSEDPKRVRFTIAHELGHFILHSNRKDLFVDHSPKILFRDSASSTGEELIEREANHFAASLLMPEKLITEQIKMVSKKNEQVSALAKKFKVSEMAMSFRLSNLGFYEGHY